MNLDNMRNLEIEQNVLGSMIASFDAALIVRDRGVKCKDFYLEKHKQLFTAINEVVNKHNQIDLVLLIEHIKNANMIEKVGGISYVAELSGNVASTANISSYIDILLEHSSKREIMELSEYIQANTKMSLKELMPKVYNKVLQIFEVGEKEATPQEYGEEFIELLNQRAAGSEDSQGIKTGLRKLDNSIGGFAKSELITLFAFSSVGKTALAVQIAINMIKQNKKVLFFSLEMPARQVIERMICNICNIESKRMRTGDIKDNEWANIIKYTSYLCSDNKFTICGTTNFSELTAKIQLEKLKNNIDIVFIDYIGLIEAPQAERRDLSIAIVTQRLKSLARKLDIPIVALAQAKQSVQSKNGGTYRVNEKLGETDIAESASIFRDSDKVIAMYRNTELDDPIARKGLESEGKLNYNSKDASVNPYCVNLLVKKCRNGTRGTLSFLWQGKYYKIMDYEE